MLILTRRIGETIRIGDDVSLMVLGVQGNQVRIGCDAPKHVAVHREEIYRRIQQEKNGEKAAPTRASHQETQKTYKPEPHQSAARPTTQMSEPALQGASFYSSEGVHTNKAPKKAPNVIVKKKRIVENS